MPTPRRCAQTPSVTLKLTVEQARRITIARSARVVWGDRRRGVGGGASGCVMALPVAECNLCSMTKAQAAWADEAVM